MSFHYSGGVSSHQYGSGVTFYATSKHCIHFPHELTATPVTQHNDRHIADRALPAYRTFAVAVDAATATAAHTTELFQQHTNLFDGFDLTLTSYTNIVFPNTFCVIVVRLYYIILSMIQRHRKFKSGRVIKRVRNLFEGQIKTPGAMLLASKVSVS